MLLLCLQRFDRTTFCRNGAEYIITKLQRFANTNYQIDACMDSIEPIVLVTTDAVWKGFENLLKRGIKGLAITQLLLSQPLQKVLDECEWFL